MPKIFVYADEDARKMFKTDELIGVAVAEDGEILVGHACETREELRRVLGYDSEEKYDIYRRKYPQGFDVVYLHCPKESLELQKALKAPVLKLLAEFDRHPTLVNDLPDEFHALTTSL